MEFEQAVRELQLKDPADGTPITAEALLSVLKEDVVYAWERPGSWEGANMLEVLTCHGFFLEKFATDHD